MYVISKLDVLMVILIGIARQILILLATLMYANGSVVKRSPQVNIQMLPNPLPLLPTAPAAALNAPKKSLAGLAGLDGIRAVPASIRESIVNLGRR